MAFLRRLVLVLLLLLGAQIASPLRLLHLSAHPRPATLLTSQLSRPPTTARASSTTALASTAQVTAIGSDDPHQMKPTRAFFTREVLAGMVTAVATIPTSVAYATVVGVSPLVGIWSSAITGFFSAVVGREPGMITAAAGVIAIPMGLLVKSHGMATMTAAVFLAGMMEYLFGSFQLGTKIGLYCEDECDVFSGSLIRPSIIAGFMNAFGLFLIKSQIKMFKSFAPSSLMPSIATALLTLAGIQLFPLVTKAVPGTLLGLVFASILSSLLQLPLLTLRQYAGPSIFNGGIASLPTLSGLQALLKIPTDAPSLWALLQVILVPAIGVATISILETAIAADIAGTNNAKYDSSFLPHGNRAMKGLGIGNVASALLGGFGGCGVIPNTQLNNKSGGRTGVSSLSYSVGLMVAVVALAPVIGAIPLAALGGLMLHVAFNTIEWGETRHLVRQFVNNPSSAVTIVDLGSLITTAVLCVKLDMGSGVLAGIAVSKMAPIINAIKRVISNQGSESRGSGI